MPTYRRPKGVYTRPGPDFFIGYTAVVGGAYTSSMGVNAAVALYNNDQASRYYHVYGVMVGNDAESFYTIKPVKGNSGSVLDTAHSVVVNGLPPSGQCYGYDVPNQSHNNDPVAGAYLFGNNVTGSMDFWQMPGPICVLPPGYSLEVATFEDLTSGTLSILIASFYYALLSDPG